jgi:hypothetical protein
VIVATIEVWNSEGDQPEREFEKEFFSKEALDAWINQQNKRPFLFTILKGFTEV